VLIKTPFTVESWFEPRFLKESLKELGLENYWAPIDATGVAPGAQVKSAQL